MTSDKVGGEWGKSLLLEYNGMVRMKGSASFCPFNPLVEEKRKIGVYLAFKTLDIKYEQSTSHYSVQCAESTALTVAPL